MCNTDIFLALFHLSEAFEQSVTLCRHAGRGGVCTAPHIIQLVTQALTFDGHLRARG
jgi:hypothetical protein